MRGTERGTGRRIGLSKGMIRRSAYAFGRRNRARKAQYAIDVAERIGAKSVLLVGVDARSRGVNNLVERDIAATLPGVVASGLAPDGEGWDDYVQADALDLPFADGQFDLVYSNAVIEHVGGEQRQRRMLAEIARVGRSWIVTTPNRWFPVEAHRHTLFSHWRRAWTPAGGSITRLLDIRDLDSMLPDGRVLGWPVVSPTLTAVHIEPERHRSELTEDGEPRCA